MKDKPVGTYFFALNAVIIMTAGIILHEEKPFIRELHYYMVWNNSFITRYELLI